MAFDTAAGASISFVADAPATFDDTGYAALTYSAAAEVTNIGEFGREYALVTHSPLASRGIKKSKGSYNNGQISPTMAFDGDDAGQGVLETAETSDDPISVKVELDDGRIFYFQALVMTLKRVVGENDSIVMLNATMEITENDIVEVDPV